MLEVIILFVWSLIIAIGVIAAILLAIFLVTVVFVLFLKLMCALMFGFEKKENKSKENK